MSPGKPHDMRPGKLALVRRGEVQALIDQGWTNVQMAAHFGCTPGAMAQYRLRHKLAKPNIAPAEVAALAAAGYFDQEIARRLGSSPASIRRLRKMHGIELSRVARQLRVEAEKRRDKAALPKPPPKAAVLEKKIARLYAGQKHEDVSAAVLAREFIVRTVRTVRNIAEIHDPQFRGEFP